MIVEPERYLENFAEATTAAPVAAGATAIVAGSAIFEADADRKAIARSAGAPRHVATEP